MNGWKYLKNNQSKLAQPHPILKYVYTMNNNNQIEQIKQFLYGEICERREYSASRMCEEVLKFINQINGGDNMGENNGVMNNIPDNINTTGNISDNRWTRTLTNDRTVFETDLWNKTVNWDKMNQPNKVMDEEQAPYNVNGDKNNKIADPYNDNHVYIDEVMLDIYVDMYLDHGRFDFDVPEWLDDAWEGDAEKDLASAVLYSFRMFLENRDWVNEDNDDVDEDKWDESFI